MALLLLKYNAMQTFYLNYHKNSTLLFCMVSAPISIAGLTLAVLLNLPHTVSQYVFISIIIASFLLMIILLKWLINTKIIINAEISLNHKGLHFKLKKDTFFYQTKDFFSGWENVDNVEEIFCSKTGKYFYKIKFTNPNFIANFSAIGDDQYEADRFYTELTYYQETYSTSQPKLKTSALKNRFDAILYSLKE